MGTEKPPEVARSDEDVTKPQAIRVDYAYESGASWWRLAIVIDFAQVHLLRGIFDAEATVGLCTSIYFSAFASWNT